MPTITNGSLIIKGNQLGSVVTFICNSDFTLIGSTSRQCLHNNKWSGLKPKCMGEIVLNSSTFI